MKKGDVVLKTSNERTIYEEFKVGESGVIIKGPYEKNITDLILRDKPWLSKAVKVHEIKRVIDVLSEGKIYKYCIVENFEKVRK